MSPSLSAILIDTDLAAAKELEALLHSLNIGVRQIAGNINEAKTLLQASKVDLVFLDIDVYRSYVFEEVQQIIKQFPVHVVFTVSASSQLVNMLEMQGLEYLSKPYSTGNMDNYFKVTQARQTRQNPALLGQYHARMQAFSDFSPDNEHPHIWLKMKGHNMEKLPIDTIIYFAADGFGSYACATGRDRIWCDHSLGALEKMLEGRGFLYVHNRFLVNSRHIHAYERQSGTLMLSQNHQLLSNDASIESRLKTLRINIY